MGNLSEQIKNLRQTMSWSQEDLAREVGVSLSTVQRWETKDVKPIRLAQKELQKLLRKVSLD